MRDLFQEGFDREAPVGASTSCRVAQICNLLYRRIASCGPSAGRDSLRMIDALPWRKRAIWQSATRVQLCATWTESLRDALAPVKIREGARAPQLFWP
jgi:hypothetical protein